MNEHHLFHDIEDNVDEEKLTKILAWLPEETQKLIKTIPENLRSELILTFFKLQTGKQGSELIDITVSDVHRNEQANIVALCKGVQTIHLPRIPLDIGDYYALVPAKGDSEYLLSSEGGESQDQIRNEYGSELERFPRDFVARVYASVTLYISSAFFWLDMKNTGLFKYWDPERGPYTWCKGNSCPEVQMLRVYQIDRDLTNHIVQTNKFKHALEWVDNPVCCHGVPVLNNDDMKQQLEKFNEILSRHGNPLANGPY